ncbi:MAG: hypothetical protein RQ952_02590 [Thermoproteota archaeon]|jgi:ABC-2 type transport system permease protein|nr:hypothetical protein [Thermoproteota archaeon]
MVGRIIKRIISKIFAEVERGFTIYTRYKVWLISDLISTPFWVLMLLYGIMLYATQYIKDPNVISALTWGIFVFVFVSTFLGMSSTLVIAIHQGILEYVLMTNSSIVSHLVGRAIMSLIDTFTIGAVIFLLNTTLFGAKIYLADPLFFFISIILALLFFLFFGATWSFFVVNLRSPWVANQVLQFVLPFFGGAIPIQLFSKDFASVILYSPFYYVIGPIISAATGYYPFDKYLMLIFDIIAVLIMAIIAYRVQNIIIKNALKKGKFSLF